MSTVRRRDTKGTAPEQDSRPISEEEQEAVIHDLRRKSDSNKRTARALLDGLVIVGILMVGRQTLRYADSGAPPLLTTLTALQTLLLLFSLSPGTTRVRPVEAVTTNYHQLVAGAQLLLFLAVFLLFRKNEALPPATLVDMTRWALPEIVTGAVQMQRNSERDAERDLAGLEKLKYDLKGA